MKRYPKYKDSGQSWVGEIPYHWELKPNRSLFRDVGQTVENKGDGVLLLSLTQNGLIPRDMDNPSGKFPSDFSTYQKVKIGDLVFCLFDVDETPRTVGISNHEGMITGAYTVVRCYNNNHAKYLYWFYLSLDEDKRLKPLYRGLRKIIPSETFRSIKSPMPPEHEAKSVCQFIEKEVRFMDSAIESQERMIELLKERRSAIITQAVTKGLNPNAKMKDSGVPWLGQVPAHWEVKALKFLLSLNQGGAWGEEPSGKNDTVVLRSTEQTKTGDWIIEEPAVRSLSENERKKTLLKKGDILVTKASGSEDHIGKSSLVDDKVASLNASYSNFMQRLRARPGVDPRLILFMLNSRAVREQFVYLSNSTSGLGNISSSILNNVVVAEPSTEEQLQIVDYISDECRKIDTSIVAEEKLIELLKERRSAIITQAVTGQIDVSR